MSEKIIRMLGEKYPDLVDEIHQNYRAGIGGVLIWKKSDPDYDPLPELVRIAAYLGYHAGQQDAKEGRDIRGRITSKIVTEVDQPGTQTETSAKSEDA